MRGKKDKTGHKKRKRSLCFYLHALEEQSHDVGTGHQLLHLVAQALSQATEQIQCNDHEILIRGLVLVGVLVVHLFGSERKSIVIKWTIQM